METNKKCKNCGKLIERRNKRGKWESMRDFTRRQFCNKRCSSTFQHAAEKSPEAVEVAKAVEDASTGTEKERKTAIQILEDAANNEKLDWVTRINAAKALAPYQSSKTGDKGGKKAEREEAAKKVGAGRFAPASAPKVFPIKKQG